MKNLLIGCIMFLAGCAGSQTLRGSDYTRTERPPSYEGQPGESKSILPYIVWGTVTIGVGLLVWYEFKKPKQ